MLAGFVYMALMVALSPPVSSVLHVERETAALYSDTSYTEMEERVSSWRNSSDLFRKELLQSLARVLDDHTELGLDNAERLSEKPQFDATLYLNGGYRSAGDIRFRSRLIPRSRTMHSLESVRRS